MAGHCVQSDIPPGVLFKLLMKLKFLGFHLKPVAILIKEYAV